MLRGQYAMACRWAKAGKPVDVAHAKFLFDEANGSCCRTPERAA